MQNIQDIALDPSSWLPIKQSSGNQETQFKEWGVVEGVRYPRVTALVTGSQKRATITVDWINLNRGLDKRELSAKPRDLKPDLGVDSH